MKPFFGSITFPKPKSKGRSLHECVYYQISHTTNKDLLEAHSLEVAGIPLMLEALEYHYKNFLRNEKKLKVLLRDILFPSSLNSKVKLPVNRPIQYNRAFFEFSAYMCSLGKLDKLIRSKWLCDGAHVPKDIIPKLLPTFLSGLAHQNIPCHKL